LWARAPFKLAEYCMVEINRVTSWQENNNLQKRQWCKLNRNS
jgi:hypothetical protein